MTSGELGDGNGITRAGVQITGTSHGDPGGVIMTARVAALMIRSLGPYMPCSSAVTRSTACLALSWTRLSSTSTRCEASNPLEILRRQRHPPPQRSARTALVQRTLPRKQSLQQLSRAMKTKEREKPTKQKMKDRRKKTKRKSR